MGLNKIVDFSTAKLLKEKGFDLYCIWSYWRNSELTSHTPGYALEDGTTSQENYWDFDRYYAPTIAEVVMWLYEKHGIWIACNLDLSNSQLFDYRLQKKNYLKLSEIDYNSPTEAYEAAIDYTLNNLI